MFNKVLLATAIASGVLGASSASAFGTGPQYTPDDNRPMSVISVCYLNSPSNEEAAQPVLDALCEAFRVEAEDEGARSNDRTKPGGKRTR